MVSDNGPPFTSKEFEDFLSSNGIAHIFSAPYHPASNGAAENAVKTVKGAIKKAIRENVDINLFLNIFLLHYRNTEHCTTGEAPASLMLGRRLRTKLDALRPDRSNRVVNRQKHQQDGGPKGLREFRQGDNVWLRQYGSRDKWVQGSIAERLGITDYKVVDTMGKESHKHVDQLKSRPRSSLVCRSSPVRRCSPRKDGTESPNRSEGSFVEPSEDYFEDCEEVPQSYSPSSAPIAAPEPALSPAQPSQSRPIRQCRIDHPPRYNI